MGLPSAPITVWVVTEIDSNAVLGVFSSQEKADAFVESNTMAWCPTEFEVDELE